MNADKKLYLVDGSSYLFRAFHALPPLSNSEGQPTGAMLGVLNMVRRLRKHYQPEHLAVVFDAPGKTFRHDAYAEYKANRPAMPEELAAQIQPLHELIRMQGIPLIMVSGVEADDVIATLVTQARAQGWQCLVSSGDKDLAQLVDAGVVLEDTMQERKLDRAGVEARFGLPPELIGDYLALIGDNSDNIPGIPGCGPKTAVKWLQQYGDLDGVIAHAAEIKGKIGERLREHLQQLRLSRQLVSLKHDVQLEQSIDDLTLAEADAGLIDKLKQYEFSSWLRELQGAEDNSDSDHADCDASGNDAAENSAIDTITVLDEDTLQAMLQRLQQAAVIAFDTETTSIEPMRASLVGMSFAISPTQAWYVPLAHDYPGAPAQLPQDQLLAALKPLLENPDIAKRGQNLKYDVIIMRHVGIELAGISHDTMLESYCYNSTANRHNLDVLAKTWLDHTTISFSDIAGSGKKQLHFNDVSIADAAPYAGEDAALVLALHESIWPKLSRLSGPSRVFSDIEMPLLPVLARMEYHGVLIDAERLRAQSSELGKTIHAMEQKAHELAGQPFNLGSPKQLQEILFEQMGLPVVAKTPTGQPSTAENVLHELAIEHELPQVILNYRSLSKLKSTYTDTLPEQIHPRTGRIHTSYQQAVTSTGRLSSSDPNLQNIPVRSEEGRRIRKAFVAPHGYQLLAADYSQVELRIMAHLSGDAGLLEAFAAGADIHAATAAEVFDVALDAVSSEQRRAAKAINFGLIYGMSAWGLARQLEVEQKLAQAYIDTYFERYPGVLDYMERTRKQARAQGYVETIHGRRLWLPEIASRNGARRQAAERAAINAPMQGSAADIIKLAMIDIDHWLREQDIDARMVMQVHDELVLEVPSAQAKDIAAEVQQRMSAAAELKVELVVDCGIADDWEAAH
ncbi:MAG: DNA polymerase I [Gammaproteobacteria bacterium]|nr:DNA polymerase I [Gammaproteobacteria bacterium]